jgi:hypothetical protein
LESPDNSITFKNIFLSGIVGKHWVVFPSIPIVLAVIKYPSHNSKLNRAYNEE